MQLYFGRNSLLNLINHTKFQLKLIAQIHKFMNVLLIFQIYQFNKYNSKCHGNSSFILVMLIIKI